MVKDFDEKRFDLEESKVWSDQKLQRQKLYIESKLKRRELEISSRQLASELDKPWWKTSIPWLAPTLSAFIAVMTLILTNSNNNRDRITAENNRTTELKQQREFQEREFKNKEVALKLERETAIILQATKDVSVEQAKKNLLFFARLNSIGIPEAELKDLFEEELIPNTGSNSTSQSSIYSKEKYTLGSGKVALEISYGNAVLGFPSVSMSDDTKFENPEKLEIIVIGDADDIRGKVLTIFSTITNTNNLTSQYTKIITLSDSENQQKYNIRGTVDTGDFVHALIDIELE